MHRHRLREIADQSGLSVATVDRVLNARPGVRPSTVAQVERAVDELDRQSEQVHLGGRRFHLDLVMQAPRRFSDAVRTALEAELPGFRPAMLRSRFHLREEGTARDLARTLTEIERKGSAGVLLKAVDDPAVLDAVDRLSERGIPVVTFATDLPLSRRVGYVGIDNRAAGATAAFLVDAMSAGPTTPALVTLSSNRYRGEEEREIGFRTAMRELAPDRPIREVSETDGLDRTMFAAVTRVLATDLELGAVYSIGGGNLATLDAFHRAGRTARPFVAHDLDADNAGLLRQRRITAVLHHDLRADMRQACWLVLQAAGALPGPPRSVPSAIQIVTPYNRPPR